MLTRKIGKLVRGKTTPFQIVSACVLGAMIGFVPGFAQAPGLLLTLVLLLLVLNANLFLAGVVGLLALALQKAFLLPIAFSIGRFLLDGPTQGLFAWAVNAPVLAWFGFDYYAVTGGQALGIVLGGLTGFAVVKAVGTMRRRLAKLETESDRYQKLQKNFFSRSLAWILFGSHKKSYEELLTKRVGNPIRIVGVICVVLALGMLVVARMLLSEPILTAGLQRGLERANGATVELTSAKLDSGSTRLTVTGLAMADPNALGTNLFEAATLQADLSLTDALRRRVALDRVEVTDAASGMARQVPGVLISPPEPSRAPEPETPNEKTMDDYLKSAEKWKERLAQVRRWLERATGEGEDPTDEPTDAEGKKQRKESLEERLRREIASLGYAHVRASHLIQGSPTFIVKELVVNGVRVAQLDGEIIDINGTNVTAQPWLTEGGATLKVDSRSGTLAALVTRATPTGDRLMFRMTGIDGAKVYDQISFSGTQPLQGGTLDVSFDGAWDGATVDLPLSVMLHNATVTLPGAGAQQVSELSIPLGVRGPIDNPQISFETEAFARALADAGFGALADRARSELEGVAGDAINKATEGLGDKIGEGVGENLEKGVGDAIGGLLGGKKDKDKKKDETPQE